MAEPIHLPDSIANALEPLFTALPLTAAMPQLVVTGGGSSAGAPIVDKLVRDPAIAGLPALVAGLWLYVDELDHSHVISQDLDDATGSFWHGIMHRREGDFSNSHYWFRRVGKHPAMKRIEGYDPHAFIDDVESTHQRGGDPAGLIDMQRREWTALFEWCVQAR